MRTSISIRTAVANGMQLTLHVERQLSSVLKPDVVDDCMLHRLDVVLVSAGEEAYAIGLVVLHWIVQMRDAVFLCPPSKMCANSYV